MKKSFMLIAAMLLTTAALFAQDGKTPVFSASDKLDEYGEWQTGRYLTIKGNEDSIKINYRHKVIKKVFLTCKFTVELKNDSNKKILFYYLSGNSRTNYYAGNIGTIKEKVKLGPGESTEITYVLPTKGFKASSDEEVCKKCKELEHLFMFGNLETK